MSDREKIFSSVRQALAPLSERASYPDWQESLAFCVDPQPDADPIDRFKRQFSFAHGRLVESWSELAQLLKELNALKGYIDPQLQQAAGNALSTGLTMETSFDRTRVDDYAFGITRATGAIAETGSLILTDRNTSARLAALAPWVHVAVLNRADIVPSVAEAIVQFDNDPSIIWATGPSKTADIEGILIEGVHGPGIQVCLLV